jgi:hypothetical protein
MKNAENTNKRQNTGCINDVVMNVQSGHNALKWLASHPLPTNCVVVI